jgi:2-C-methyl-D-erythritol 4-phosphate cytidylyltransferase
MSSPGAVWAVVVAAGSGNRFGGPKQFSLLAGARVVDRSVAVARVACDGVVLVLTPDAAAWDGAPVDSVVAGGATRAESVRAGLAAVPDDAAVIVVHDAARPLATDSLYRAVIAAVRAGADGALPGLPVTDTLKRVEGDAVVATVTRDALVAAQTPQAFRAEALRTAHAGDGEATDDAALVEAAGGKVVIVPGDPANVKLTVPRDFVVAEALLAAATDEHGAEGDGA